ncbi:hypothetical protein CHLRE_15g637450v5 [Chlamydomonas reinhardtii]|uniref:Uncharacterized protein n=1 Tax=Chlamydomonas reinhardtii TaxID=3055 RepID=A0A2K3CWK5_CHLRE|nr:uncharacterized protein CHLRE_15g637450v5 [Chlamydomonas reinhardtii]PNW72659.1 hypothetical protein CHLRE_15g637450v5 [Chlamydomonas reinhardtii]
MLSFESGGRRVELTAGNANKVASKLQQKERKDAKKREEAKGPKEAPEREEEEED